MSIGTVLTLGLGAFTDGGVQFLPTLGYGTSGAPPAPPTPASATPGFVGRVLDTRSRYESEEEKSERRIREGTIPAPVKAPSADLERYSAESARLARAVERFRDDAEKSRQRIAQLEAAQAKRLTEAKKAQIQRDLLRAEQALALAAAQEAAMLEEMEVLDVAFVAIVALGVVYQ